MKNMAVTVAIVPRDMETNEPLIMMTVMPMAIRPTKVVVPRIARKFWVLRNPGVVAAAAATTTAIATAAISGSRRLTSLMNALLPSVISSDLARGGMRHIRQQFVRVEILPIAHAHDLPAAHRDDDIGQMQNFRQLGR